MDACSLRRGQVQEGRASSLIQSPGRKLLVVQLSLGIQEEALQPGTYSVGHKTVVQAVCGDR